jgi:hypothetical protein
MSIDGQIHVPASLSAVERPPVYSASDHVGTQRMWRQWWREQILDLSGSHFPVHIVSSNDDELSGHFVIRTSTIFAYGWHHQTTVTYWVSCVISGFCRLLWRNVGWYLPTFRDDLSTQAVQKESLTLEYRTNRLLRSVGNYQSTVCNIQEEKISNIMYQQSCNTCNL